jgi:type II secretory pathway pseudopilin PulG
VVISIIALLMAIIVPVLGKAKSKARALTGMSNKRQIITALDQYAFDNERYPLSVATVGAEGPYRTWNYWNPNKLAGNEGRTYGVHRSVGEYLNTYIADAEVMYCPSAPRKYKYLQESWDAGDSWDNPETFVPTDPVGGTYCFFWEYTGFLGGRRVTLQGPRSPAAGRAQSKLLVTDYFVCDNWRTLGYYSSCEKIRGAEIAPETTYLSANWSFPADPNLPVPEVKLQAGYIDGHVEIYSTSSAIQMEVSSTKDGRTPYPRGRSPGTFYLPEGAIH